MFNEMAVPVDQSALERAFRSWLSETMPSGTYRAWLVESDAGDIVAGGGITLLPWPPGPHYLGGRLAFVYNVYTRPAHRRQGIGRLVMDTIHAWCRDAGVLVVVLNASADGLSLYESMGYHVSPAPMMFLGLM